MSGLEPRTLWTLVTHSTTVLYPRFPSINTPLLPVRSSDNRCWIKVLKNWNSKERGRTRSYSFILVFLQGWGASKALQTPGNVHFIIRYAQAPPTYSWHSPYPTQTSGKVARYRCRRETSHWDAKDSGVNKTTKAGVLLKLFKLCHFSQSPILVGFLCSPPTHPHTCLP